MSPYLKSIALCALILGVSSAPAAAEPKIGDVMSLQPTDYPKMNWSFGAPSPNDAAGKVVIHWFCTPKVALCIDDLARIVTQEHGKTLAEARAEVNRGIA